MGKSKRKRSEIHVSSTVEGTDLERRLPCFVCASVAGTADYEHLTEAERLEFGVVFKGFCKLFKVSAVMISDDKPVPLCQECNYQLSKLLLVRKMVRELKKELTAGVREFKEKCKAAEESFQSEAIYSRDERYREIRQQLLSDCENRSFITATNTPTTTTPPPRKTRSAGNVVKELSTSAAEPSELPVQSKSKVLKNRNRKTGDSSLSSGEAREDTAEERRKRTHEEKLLAKGSTGSMIDDDEDKTEDVEIQKRIAKRKKLKRRSSSSSEDEVNYFKDEYEKYGEDEEITKVECPICTKPYSNTDRMKRHMFTHYNEQDLTEAQEKGVRILKLRKPPKAKCEKCGKILSSKAKLKHHRKVFHPPERKSSDSTIMRIKREEGELEFLCTVCDLLFPTQNQLQNHQMVNHSNVQFTFKCPQCSKVFGRRDSLTQHLMRHQNKRPFQCKLCSKAYVTSTHLRRHERNFHEKV